MSKSKHPSSRAERRRIKYKKDKFESFESADALNRRHQFEALETKEALDDIRKQVLAVEEEERQSP